MTMGHIHHCLELYVITPAIIFSCCSPNPDPPIFSVFHMALIYHILLKHFILFDNEHQQ